MFLISSYGTPLAQRATYLALHITLFGPDGTLNYDYIATNSINYLLIAFPMAHTLTIAEPIWLMLQKLSKTLMYMHFVFCKFHLWSYQSTCTCQQGCRNIETTLGPGPHIHVLCIQFSFNLHYIYWKCPA